MLSAQHPRKRLGHQVRRVLLQRPYLAGGLPQRPLGRLDLTTATQMLVRLTLSTPGESQANGIAERANRLVLDTTHVLLYCWQLRGLDANANGVNCARLIAGRSRCLTYLLPAPLESLSWGAWGCSCSGSRTSLEQPPN